MDVSANALNVAAADELRAESARQGVMQKDVFPAAGVSQGTMSNKWWGKVPLTIGEFCAWCDVLGIEAGEMIERANDRAVDQYARDLIDEGLIAADDSEDQDGRDLDKLQP